MDDADDRFYTEVEIHVIHGGRFVNENSYIGGKTHIVESGFLVLFSRAELESIVKSLGYISILKSAFRGLDHAERYTFFDTANEFKEYILDHVDVESRCLKIYVQCLDYDSTIEVPIDEQENMSPVSKYESSNDSPYSLESDDEEIGYRRSKKNCKSTSYKNTTDERGLVFKVGMQFYDFKECKEAIRDWAIENGYNIGWKRSDEKRLEARCDGACPWNIYACRLAHQSTFIIKSIVDKHTCIRSDHNRQANCDWLASVIMPRLKRNVKYPVKEIIADIQLRYKVTVNEDLCYRAKAKALEQFRGSFESHYKKLKSYVAHLQQMDREGRFFLKTNLNSDQQPVFERVYIGFSALRKGFLKGCRRCICFDACFLKTVLGGALLAAVAKDCNDKMWPIAWAVVENESEASWTWFFNHLFEDLNIVDGLNWTFMSDKHRGIINGIMKLTPQAEHRYCARHIYENWKKSFRGSKLKKLFWDGVKCTSMTEFNLTMELLKTESDEGHKEFMEKEPRRFCRSSISTSTKTNMVDNNICETFNSYILKFRDKPIIDMLESIRQSLMSRSPKMVKKLEASSYVLCPSVNNKLDKLQNRVHDCIILPALGKKFEVHIFDSCFVVDLLIKECSCRAWALTGIPCYHALACIYHVREDAITYVDEFYHKANCMEAYKHCLTPIYGPRNWPNVEGPAILPPPFVRGPGRLRKNRRRDPTEEPSTARKRGNVQCKRCKLIGHNQRTCKNPPAEHVSSTESSQPKKQKAGRPARTADHQVQKEMRQARKGYGVLTGSSGTIYIRPPGGRHTTVLRRQEEVPSQSSQVFDASQGSLA